MKQTHRILRTVLRRYAAGASLQASVVRGCDKIARVMTLSYDFLHEHAIGRTSNESARTTMRSIVHICMYMGDYRIRDFLYNFNRHSKGERTNGVHFKKGERTIGSDHMKTLCIIRLYIYLITTNENNNTDALFMLLAQMKWLAGLY